MAQLNHTIVWCSDKKRSANFLTDLLGLPPARPFLHFLVIELENGVSLDFLEKSGPVCSQHYAFLVSDSEFDSALRLIKENGVAHWADPGRSQPGQTNTHFGGRGVYFADPDDHLMELVTKPYGSETEL